MKYELNTSPTVDKLRQDGESNVVRKIQDFRIILMKYELNPSPAVDKLRQEGESDVVRKIQDFRIILMKCENRAVQAVEIYCKLPDLKQFAKLFKITRNELRR